jgi:hypothetical protein
MSGFHKNSFLSRCTIVYLLFCCAITVLVMFVMWGTR